MLTEYQAQKIRRDMEPELNARGASVMACLAGLFIVVVLAATEPQIGTRADMSRPVAAAETEAPASQPAALDAAAAQDTAGATMETHATRAPINGNDNRERFSSLNGGL